MLNTGDSYHRAVGEQVKVLSKEIANLVRARLLSLSVYTHMLPAYIFLSSLRNRASSPRKRACMYVCVYCLQLRNALTWTKFEIDGLAATKAAAGRGDARKHNARTHTCTHTHTRTHAHTHTYTHTHAHTHTGTRTHTHTHHHRCTVCVPTSTPDCGIFFLSSGEHVQ
jgi:hypothetical protein